MNLDRIVASAPLNRTAAIVAGGKRPSAPDPLARWEEERANLVRALDQIEAVIKAGGKQARAAFGGRKLELQNELKALKERKPKINRRKELAGYLIEVVKERVASEAWQEIYAEGVRRWEAAEGIARRKP